MKCIGEQCQYCIPHLFNESCVHCTLQYRTFKKDKANNIECRILDKIDDVNYELKLLINMESEINKVNKELNLID